MCARSRTLRVPLPWKRATTILPICGGVSNSFTASAPGSISSTLPPSAARRCCSKAAIRSRPSLSRLPDSISTRLRRVSMAADFSRCTTPYSGCKGAEAARVANTATKSSGATRFMARTVCPNTLARSRSRRAGHSRARIHNDLRRLVEIEPGRRHLRAECVPRLGLAIAELAVPLQRSVVRLGWTRRVADVGAERPRLLVGAVALHVHLVEEDRRSSRRVRVQPRQDRGHVVRPVLALHSQAGGTGEIACELSVRARTVWVEMGDLPRSREKRRRRRGNDRPPAR